MRLVTMLFMALLVVVVFSFTMSGCSTYVPYSSDSHMFPYEGFRSNLADTSAVVAVPGIPDAGTVHKIGGFQGIYGTTEAVDRSLDIFSTAPGDMTCPSYGYANSRGFLCMNADQARLLRSRGGNASGGDMQIGGK